MSRKIGTMDFARIWGWVSKLSRKQWAHLVELRGEQDQEMIVPAATEPKERKSRKPRESECVVHPETEVVVRKMRLRKGDGSLASETPEGGAG